MLLNILKKYSEAFSTEVDGKSQAMTTKELPGGACIHHIFQSIFEKSLEEVDPCDDLSDEDIRIAIHNELVQEIRYLCQRSHLKFWLGAK